MLENLNYTPPLRIDGIPVDLRKASRCPLLEVGGVFTDLID